MKFEDCQRNREVGFISNDPNFSVRPDGSVYTEQEVANLSEPVQFMVTAQGLHEQRIWETTVKLALAGHPHSLALAKVESVKKCCGCRVQNITLGASDTKGPVCNILEGSTEVKKKKHSKMG